MFNEESSWFRHLKALGESRGFLTYAQVNDVLPATIVDPLEIEEIVDKLKGSGIQVVPDSPQGAT